MTILFGTAGKDTLTGGLGQDTLFGSYGDDHLLGDAGNDYLSGEIGQDFMAGGAGNDVYIRDSSNDVVVEAANAGTDTVRSELTYSLGANLENLTLTGEADIQGTGNVLANLIKGNGGANRISGKGGADKLLGGGGDDTIRGGTGSDTLTGGDGRDVFVLGPDGSTESITDFFKHDIIRVAGLNAAASITSGTGETVLANEIQVSTVGIISPLTTLSIGLDSTPGADLRVRLTGDYDADDVWMSGSDIATTLSQSGGGFGGFLDTVIASINFSLSSLAFVENLTLGGQAITAAGNELSNTLAGNDLDNVIEGLGGNDVLRGEGGNDHLLGGSGTTTCRAVPGMTASRTSRATTASSEAPATTSSTWHRSRARTRRAANPGSMSTC